MKDGLTDYQARHFLWSVQNRVGSITLNRPDRKNPLTFDSYAELRDLMRRLTLAPDVKAIVIGGADCNFFSRGAVQASITPLTRTSVPALLNFPRPTGDHVQPLRARPPP